MSYENSSRHRPVVRALYAVCSPQRKVTLALHDRLRPQGAAVRSIAMVKTSRSPA